MNRGVNCQEPLTVDLCVSIPVQTSTWRARSRKVPSPWVWFTVSSLTIPCISNMRRRRHVFSAKVIQSCVSSLVSGLQESSLLLQLLFRLCVSLDTCARGSERIKYLAEIKEAANYCSIPTRDSLDTSHHHLKARGFLGEDAGVFSANSSVATPESHQCKGEDLA